MASDCKTQRIAGIELDCTRGHLPRLHRILVGRSTPGLANSQAMPLRRPCHRHGETWIFLDGMLQLRTSLGKRFPTQPVEPVHSTQRKVVRSKTVRSATNDSPQFRCPNARNHARNYTGDNLVLDVEQFVVSSLDTIAPNA